MLVAALVAGLVAAQQDHSSLVDANVLRLTRIRARMIENLREMPNYTCLQTIERSRRRARARRFELLDTLRLEVALVAGKEMFSWPGAGRFEDREISELVPGGAIGNGNFAIHAKSVFQSNAPRFEYEGPREENGRRLHRYRYIVPRLLSGFKVKLGTAEGIAGYHGSFDADAGTLDLVSLDVFTDDIPTNVPISVASDELRYARTHIGERDFLLPESSIMTITDLEGNESRNRTAFSQCRQYSGQSTISFADPPPQGTPAEPVPVPVDLPEGLLLDVRLETSIVFGKAAIGDPLEGRLGSDARFHGRTFVPKNALVRGRLLRIERFQTNVPITRLAIEFNELEFPGARASFRATLEDFGPVVPGVSTAADKQGIIVMRGSRQEIARGVRMLWRIERKENNK